MSTCDNCLTRQQSPMKAPVHPWEVPRQPWSSIHVDFAGPFQGQNFLVEVDTFSRWIEVVYMKSATASNTTTLCRLFTTHGIPDSIVSDNVPQFTSKAASNDQAKRTVQ